MKPKYELFINWWSLERIYRYMQNIFLFEAHDN